MDLYKSFFERLIAEAKVEERNRIASELERLLQENESEALGLMIAAFAMGLRDLG